MIQSSETLLRGQQKSLGANILQQIYKDVGQTKLRYHLVFLIEDES
jgi:hypothetical protein